MNINEYNHLQQEIQVTVMREEVRYKDKALITYQSIFMEHQLLSPNNEILNITKH